MKREELQARLSVKQVEKQVRSVVDELEGLASEGSAETTPIQRAQLARVWFDSLRHQRDRLFAAIERSVGQPCPLTQAEVGDSFVEQFFVDTGDEIEARHERFVRSLTARTAIRNGSPFLITERFCVGPLDKALLVWKNRHFSLSLTGASASESGFNAGATYGQLAGDCTLAALESAQEQIRAASRSILYSMVMAGVVPGVDYHPVYGFHQERVQGCVDIAGDDLAWQGRLGPLWRCLETYFSESEKRDSFSRRLHNAVQLLKEADEQDQPAIRLALSFSAIEAMVCDKHESITDQLARRVTTLLEPAADRRGNGIRPVKQLYDSRSKLLHGEEVESRRYQAARVRILAARVLLAVLEWEHCRMGPPADRKSLIAELDEAQRNETRLLDSGQVTFDFEVDVLSAEEWGE